MSYKNLVNVVFENLGLDSYDCWDGNGWNFNHDSLPVFIRPCGDNNDTITVNMGINKLPRQNLLPLYRKLLELNVLPIVAKIAIFENNIVVTSARPVEGMDAQELFHLIDTVCTVGRNLSIELENDFGAPSLRIQ